MEQETGSAGFVPTPIDDILRADDAPPSEPAGRPEPQAAPEPRETGEAAAPPEAKDNRPRDEAGRFAPKAEAAPAPQNTGTPPAENGPKLVPVSVAIEERKKRQALEAELAELRARAAQPQQPAPPPQQVAPQQAPDFWADPDAHLTHREQQIVARLEQEMVRRTVALSEAIARQQPDYEDAEKALFEYAQANPQLRQQIGTTLATHATPAMWAYEQGKRLLAAQAWAPVQQQHASPDAFIKAEVERQVAERMARSPAPSSAPPPPASLASARSAGPRVGPAAYTGPTPLTSILGRR